MLLFRCPAPRYALVALGLGLFASPVMAQTDQDATATMQEAPAQESDDGQPAQAGFASLADAVAAQPQDDDLDDDTSCLAGAIYFESKGEPLAGQLAVADVILNRTRSGRFPTTICSVVMQPGQFSFVRGGRIPDIADGAHYRTAIAVARVAMAGLWQSPAADTKSREP